MYADEFNAFAAIEGNTVTVVPEPGTLLLSAMAGMMLLFLRNHWG